MNKLPAFNLVFKPLGDSAMLIEWPPKISESILEDIISLQSEVENLLHAYLVESVNAYNSLTLIFNPDSISFDALKNKIQNIYQALTGSQRQTNTAWKIPVCYDTEFGVDLEEMANAKNCEPQEIIDRHCEPLYTVFFIGFLPGFLYLGGLPETLHFARKATPRLKIRQGSVAIGGQQTGIYPQESPGGWNILGNSPVSFFSVAQDPPCFAKAGDKLQFYSIDKNEFNEVKELVKQGLYKPESQLI